jgi:hypothetical protein
MTLLNDAPHFITAAKHTMSLMTSSDLNDFVVEMRKLPQDLQDESAELIDMALKILGQRIAEEYELEMLAEELKELAA